MAIKEDGNDNLFCSFCGKNQKEVTKLIAGPAVYICDECIQLCSEIIEEETQKDTTEDLVCHSFQFLSTNNLQEEQGDLNMTNTGNLYFSLKQNTTQKN